MTFLKLHRPGFFLRAVIIGAQGVFYNLFFLSYMIHPAACHRFVGCLEEEACLTYSLVLKEIDAGRLPEWDDVRVPRIALNYWRLPDSATMRDLIAVIRADEAGHR